MSAPAWDEAIFFFVNAPRSEWLDAVWAAASSRLFGGALGAAAVMLVVLRFRRRAWLAVIQLGLAAGSTDLFGARVLKPLFGRVRPCFAIDPALVRVLSPAANSGSMPSLHAANAFALAVATVLLVPRAGRLLLPFAVLIAISRVACGVHWPSDVLVGAVMGSLAGLGVQLLRTRASARWAWLSTPEQQEEARPQP